MRVLSAVMSLAAASRDTLVFSYGSNGIHQLRARATSTTPSNTHRHEVRLSLDAVAAATVGAVAGGEVGLGLGAVHLGGACGGEAPEGAGAVVGTDSGGLDRERERVAAERADDRIVLSRVRAVGTLFEREGGATHARDVSIRDFAARASVVGIEVDLGREERAGGCQVS